jgi:hypothetical protein
MSEVWRNGDYEIATDPARLQIDVIHGFLRTAYWSPGVPRDIVERAARHSLNFGLYRGGAQVGYARVVTDRAVFGYLMDVFVLAPHPDAASLAGSSPPSSHIPSCRVSPLDAGHQGRARSLRARRLRALRAS